MLRSCTSKDGSISSPRRTVTEGHDHRVAHDLSVGERRHLPASWARSLSFGLSASFSPSLIRLRPNTVTMMATPGMAQMLPRAANEAADRRRPGGPSSATLGIALIRGER